jgi:hypothetical protein
MSLEAAVTDAMARRYEASIASVNAASSTAALVSRHLSPSARKLGSTDIVNTSGRYLLYLI